MSHFHFTLQTSFTRLLASCENCHLLVHQLEPQYIRHVLARSKRQSFSFLSLSLEISVDAILPKCALRPYSRCSPATLGTLGTLGLWHVEETVVAPRCQRSWNARGLHSLRWQPTVHEQKARGPIAESGHLNLSQCPQPLDMEDHQHSSRTTFNECLSTPPYLWAHTVNGSSWRP